MQRLSFRVDYNRNRIIGPAFSSVHQGTDALTNQNWNNTLNGYPFRRRLPRLRRRRRSATHRCLQYYTGGTTYKLNPFNSWPLPNGTPVTFGLPWFNSGSPCSTPLNNGIANPYVQRLLQLQSVSARQHIHSDRAAQPDVVLAEVARLQRPVSVQPRPDRARRSTKTSPA